MMWRWGELNSRAEEMPKVNLQA